jgi:riboflavin synthase
VFTGIIEELGEVLALERDGADGASGESARLRLRASVVTEDAAHGDSIAVNGVCLTVVATGEGAFTADVMAETLARSTIGALAPGDRVNLERPTRLGGRLGGHLVQGHVAGTAAILARTPGENWETVAFALPADLARYVVEKGSITVDGISLTVVSVADDHFTVGLIPTTLQLTTLGRKRVGDVVNLEVDIVGKYVERLLADRGVSAP